MRRWSVKAEYLFTNIRAQDWGGFYLSGQRVRFNTVRAGLNYRLNFSNGAPILAGFRGPRDPSALTS